MPPPDVSGIKVADGSQLQYGSVLDGQVLKRVGNTIIGIGAEPIPPPISPALFSENFETEWIVIDTFTQIFLENFESGWFISNLFNSLFIENFEGVW